VVLASSASISLPRPNSPTPERLDAGGVGAGGESLATTARALLARLRPMPAASSWGGVQLIARNLVEPIGCRHGPRGPA
jgi:hypothetical protein